MRNIPFHIKEPSHKELLAITGNIDRAGKRNLHHVLQLKQVAERAFLSPFAFHWQKGGRTYLYHSILQKKMAGSGLFLESLEFLGRPFRERSFEDLDEKLRVALCHLLPSLLEQHLVCLTEDEPRLLLEHYRQNCSRRVPDYRVLYLMLTHECNLRCPYCFFIFFSDMRPSKTFMNWDTARKGIELFEKSLGEGASDPVIIFYGGEPMLNWPVLAAAVKAIRRKEEKGGFKGRRVSLELFTNGTLLTPSTSRFLREWGVSVSLSLDGMESHNRLRREAESGRSSYQNVMRGFHHLVNAGLMPSVNLTVGRHNLGELALIIDYFSTSLGISDIRLFPVRGLTGDNCHEPPPDDFIRKLLALWPLLREKNIDENFLIEKARSCAAERCSLSYCEATGGQISVMPDGSLGPCINFAEDYLELWGSLHDPSIEKKLQESEHTSRWLRRSSFLMDGCEHCIGLGNCGGGCAHEAFTKTASMDEKDEKHCAMHPEITKWAVEALADSCEFSGRGGESFEV